MESIINQLKGNFEIVVCDNCSNDGSREILQDYAQKGKIKLIVERSSRGKGRQTAFENSTGQNIISGVDTDDILKPAFREFLDIYQRDHEGYMLSSHTIHIIPRALVEEIGGWKDLQYFEDVDFVQRAESIGKKHELNDELVLVERGKNKRAFTYRIMERYNAAICAYRIGKSVFIEVKSSEWFLKPIILVVALRAAVVCKLKHIKRVKYSET
jgi:glycosyltransferase involved in cell wall biosynthesis